MWSSNLIIVFGLILDQLANLHFRFTSVPRCTPIVWRYNGTPMEILHLVEYSRLFDVKFAHVILIPFNPTFIGV